MKPKPKHQKGLTDNELLKKYGDISLDIKSEINKISTKLKKNTQDGKNDKG